MLCIARSGIPGYKIAVAEQGTEGMFAFFGPKVNDFPSPNCHGQPEDCPAAFPGWRRHSPWSPYVIVC
jgi:hypothetical protein